MCSSVRLLMRGRTWIACCSSDHCDEQHDEDVDGFEGFLEGHDWQKTSRRVVGGSSLDPAHGLDAIHRTVFQGTHTGCQLSRGLGLETNWPLSGGILQLNGFCLSRGDLLKRVGDY